MQKIVFFVLAASLAFFFAQACSPSPSGGASGSSTGASSTVSTTVSTTTAAGDRKRRDLQSVLEGNAPHADSVVATIYTSFDFSTPSENTENAEIVAAKVREISGSEKEDFGEVRKSLKNAEGKLAVGYELSGEQFCDVAAVVGYTTARLVREIVKVDVDCNNDFLAVFYKH